MNVSADMYRLIVDAVPEAIWVVDATGRTLFSNSRMADILGVSIESMADQSCFGCVFPNELEDAQRNFARALGGDSRPFDFRLRRADGSPIWVSISCKPMLDEAGNQAGLLGLFSDITERKKAEGMLRESEERFRNMADSASVMIWMTGPDNQCAYCNRAWLEFTGRSLDTQLGSGWTAGVHPEDLPMAMEIFARALERREKYEGEYRLRRHDGEYRWIFGQAAPRFEADGSLVGYIGSGIDITERRAAQDALSSVNQRLMEGLEQERTRLARELHDDILQRLTLLKVRLDDLRSKSMSPVELEQEIDQVSQQVGECVEDVQALSHRLHSSKLEFLGLPTAAAGFCQEFSDRQNVKIDFEAQSIPEEVPPAIGLCVFRLMQEAVQNAAKHSGSRRFRVSLRGAPNELELTVGDSGAGFDLKEAMRGRGVGLTSMKERVKLVDGQLSIDSKPGAGTTIHARVPLHGRANHM